MEGYDLFRGENDTDKVWNLREIFLRAHHGKFSDEKLIALSYCFTNNALYGSQYPAGVMSQLDELTTGFAEIARLKDLQRQKDLACHRPSESEVVEIPPEELAANAPMSFVHGSRSTGATYASLPGKKVVMPQMSFVKAKASYQSTDIAMHSLGQEQPPEWNPFPGYITGIGNAGSGETNENVSSLDPAMFSNDLFASVEAELKRIRSINEDDGYTVTPTFEDTEPAADVATTEVTKTDAPSTQTTPEDTQPHSINTKPAMHFVQSQTPLQRTEITPNNYEEFVYKRPTVYTLPSEQQFNPYIDNTRSKRSKLGFGQNSQSNYGSRFNRPDKTPQEQKFYKLYRELQHTKADNSISRVTMALNKVQMVCNNHLFVTRGRGAQRTFNCTLTLDLIEVATGSGTNKKAAKHNAYDLGIEKLLFGEYKVTENDNGEKKLENPPPTEPIEPEEEQKPEVRTINVQARMTPDRRTPDHRMPDRRAPDRRTPDRRTPPDRRVSDHGKPEKFDDFKKELDSYKRATNRNDGYGDPNYQRANMNANYNNPNYQHPNTEYNDSSYNQNMNAGYNDPYMDDDRPPRRHKSGDLRSVIAAKTAAAPKELVKLRPSMHQDTLTGMAEEVEDDPNDSKESKHSKHKHKHKHHEKKAKKRKHDDDARAEFDDLSKFLILKHETDDPATQNPVAILYQSSDFNRMPLSYEYLKAEGKVRCNFSINGIPVMECVGKVEADVKKLVSEEALKKLEQICYTITKKKRTDGNEDTLSRDEVMENIEKSSGEGKRSEGSDVIPDSNIGNRLLRKMGWKSGVGIGKEGNKGIVEPVKAGPMIIRRKGFGSAMGTKSDGNTEDFKKIILKTLMDYAKSDNDADLAFSAEFSKEERALIHNVCQGQAVNLKTQSHGKGSKRYLVISKKRGNAGELFDYIMKSGGETKKYEISEPSCKQISAQEEPDFDKPQDNVPTDTPTATNTPTTTPAPTATPTTIDEPITTDAPITIDAPITTDAPNPVDAPTPTNTPTTTDAKTPMDISQTDTPEIEPECVFVPYKQVDHYRAHGVFMTKRKKKHKDVITYKKPGDERKWENMSDLSDLLIIRHEGDENQNPIEVLANTEKFNNVSERYEYTELESGKERCDYSINKIAIAESGHHDTAKEAKKSAAKRGLAKLEEICRTILKKKHVYGSEDTTVTHEGLTRRVLVKMDETEEAKSGEAKVEAKTGEASNNSTASSESRFNVLSHKMGYKMGFVSGGTSTLSEEPVYSVTTEPFNVSYTKNFEGMVDEAMLNYKRSNQVTDLAFSPKFTNQERKVIRNTSKKLHLKSKCHGDGDEKYIVISKERTSKQLFELITEGRLTNYVIIEPYGKQTQI